MHLNNSNLIFREIVVSLILRLKRTVHLRNASLVHSSKPIQLSKLSVKKRFVKYRNFLNPVNFALPRVPNTIIQEKSLIKKLMVPCQRTSQGVYTNCTTVCIFKFTGNVWEYTKGSLNCNVL